MKNDLINEEFKKNYKLFYKNVIGISDVFLNQIDNCKTNGDLKKIIEENINLISHAVVDNFECKYCKDKDDQIGLLQGELDDSFEENCILESKLDISYTPKTLNDQYKLDTFKDSLEKFSISEFEKLLN